jgi:uncharacterized protein YecT (DUF1311 family)
MKQYIVSLTLLITALVAFSTSHTNAQSQSEMNRKAAKDFEKVDARLNAVYKKVLSDLDTEGKKKLQASQRAWIAYRNAEAAFQADSSRGGSIAPSIYSITESELTEARIKELRKPSL